MPISKAKGKDNNARQAGTAVVPRNFKKKKDGGRQTRKVAAATGGIGLHLLEKQLRPISLFEINMLTKGKSDGLDYASHYERDLFGIVDTEAKQLQAIEDLYAIVKAQPKYKKMKEPSWCTDESPLVVLHWLLRKLGPLANGQRWTIDTYMDGDTTRYMFVVYKYYHSQLLEHFRRYVPLDFLPSLKKRDQPLHDIMVDVFALVSKRNKIPLWDEDGDFSEVLKQMPDTLSYVSEVMDRQIHSYTCGTADEYLKLLKSRRKIVTKEIINAQCLQYTFSSQRKREIADWVYRAKVLADTRKCITANSYVPNYTSGNPVTPYRQYKLIWSNHENDILYTKACQKIERDKNTSGNFFPMEFSITKPGQKVKPIRSDNFPVALYGFMDDILSILLGRYIRYFYKSAMMAEIYTPSTLLENLEVAELHAGTELITTRI